MTQELQKQEQTQPDPAVIEQLALHGNLKNLTKEQKVQYYNHVCESLGLNPLTNPFQVIDLQGKEVLYAKKDATDQLRRIYGVSIIDYKVDSSFQNSGIYMVTVTLQDKHGRTDTETGAVNIQGQKGNNLANAVMKAFTKAKRRGTLSICGLGMLDESETDTIPQAREVPINTQENESRAKVEQNLKEATQDAKQSDSDDTEQAEQSDEPDNDLSSGKSKMAYQIALQKLKDCQTLDELEGNVKTIADEAVQQGINDTDRKELNKQYKAIKEQLTNGDEESSGSQSTEQSGQDQG